MLEALAAIAPLTAVRGNNDRGAWADGLREIERIEVGGVSILVVHDLARLAIDPRAAGIAVVVHGHSHRPSIETRDGVLLVNPGSAGPRRFRLPVTVGRVDMAGGVVKASLIELA